jgi:hypothetical protein
LVPSASCAMNTKALQYLSQLQSGMITLEVVVWTTEVYSLGGI